MKKIFLFASAVALLASCSKDFTDDAAAPSIQGNNRIIASYEADSNAGSRSHLDGRVAGWDNGDALGVFAATASDATNAYFGFDGTAFTGDLQMVKGNDFYVYYPWSAGKTISNKNVLTLSIPATQYYNHKYAAQYGSYAAGMVPAVAKVEGVDKSKDLELELRPVVSYIGIPISGVGTVGSVTMTMTTSDESEGVVLSGNLTVDFANPNEDETKLYWDNKMDKTEFSITNPTGNGKKITLNCGEGVELSRTDAKYFVFVVPAYIDLSNGVKFTITVSDKENKNLQSYDRELTAEQLKKANIASTYRNYYLAFTSANIVWNEGGKLLIDTEEQFVKYAYLATYGWEEAFEAAEEAEDDVKAAIAAEKAEYLDGDALRSAIITKDLAFTGNLWVEKDLLESEKKALNAFEMAIYETYNVGGKNFALTSIGGTLAYNLDGNNNTISGLTFNGSVFADRQIKTSSVSNLTLNAAKVKDADFFLAKTYGVTNLTLTNVKTGEGCELTPATEGQGAFVDSFNTSSGAPVETVLPKFAESENNIKYANTLIVTKPATAATPFFVALDDAVALEGEMNIKTADYNAIKTATGGTLYVVAATTDANGKAVSVANVAKALIENNVIGYNSTATSVWHSVVTRDAKGNVTTSYWTGKAGADNNDGIFTAEELAYVVTNRVADKKTLTCNLTLSYKPWVVTATTKTDAISIDGSKKTITGAQINATGTTANNYSVFGYQANLENLTVNSTTIDFGTYAVPATAKVAVLASYPGTTVTGVTVGAPTIKIGAASKVATVGGLFAEADAAQWKAINVAKATTKITTNTNATRYLANNAKFGSVVGKLTVANSDKFTKTVTTDAVNKIVGVVDFTGAEATVDANFLNFGEGQYPGVATVLPENGSEFEQQVFVYLGIEETGADVANFFWYPAAKKWVVVAE